MSGFAVPQFFFPGGAGGYVNVYQTGTTTPVTVYSDGGLSTPITNPITLDANGGCKFYVSGSVNLRLDGYTASSSLIESIDPVYPVGGNSPNTVITGGTINGTTIGATTPSTGAFTTLTANTPAPGDSSTNVATTAFVGQSLSGGFINKFRNPGMDICQRAISGTITAGSPAYTVDGWIAGSTGANVTWDQQGGTGLSVGNAASYNSLLVTGAASVTDTFIKQRIEGIIAAQLSSQTVTFQAYINNQSGASFTPTLTVKYSSASDNWGASTIVVNAVNLQPCANGVWTKVSYTFSNAAYVSLAGLEVSVDFGAILTSNLKYIIFTQADIRVTNGVSIGLNSTPPTSEIRSYPVELAFCERYLAGFGDIAGVIGHGAATSTSASGYIIPFKVPMRIAPTGLSVTTVGDFEIATYAGVDVTAATGLTFNSSGSSNQHAFVTATVGGTPLTSAVPYYLYAKTALAGNLIFTGAEL